MYICFALLLPYDVQNQIRKMILKTSSKYGLDLVASLLPQHISLKISFNILDIAGIEDYFTEFAKTINSFSVKLSKVELLQFEKEGKKQGLLWLDVDENKVLRELHNRLNRELKEKFGIEIAGFDGDGFHFHSTLFHNGKDNTPIEAYEKAFSDFKKMEFNKTVEINEIAMFVSNYVEDIIAGTFITYKVLSLK